MPPWCVSLAVGCKALFPFDTRKRFFYSTAFGLGRALQHLQQAQTADAGGASGAAAVDRDGRGLRVGRLTRQKVHRCATPWPAASWALVKDTRLCLSECLTRTLLPGLPPCRCACLASASWSRPSRSWSSTPRAVPCWRSVPFVHAVLLVCIVGGANCSSFCPRCSVQIEFFNDVGTGLGPTLEFYTLLSHELQRADLGMWRHEERQAPAAAAGPQPMDVEGGEGTAAPAAPAPGELSVPARRGEAVAHDEAEFVHAPWGLFPRPLPPGHRDAAKVADHFRLLGRTVARTLLDSRLLDLPLSHAFYAAGELRSWSGVAVCFPCT
jgi:hypothetical protein